MEMFPVQRRVDWHASHVMIDLETYGLGPNAAIATIGACHFDPYRHSSIEELREHAFYVVIDLEDSRRWGREVDESTLHWWATQSAEAQAALKDNPRPLFEAFRGFMAWLTGWDYNPSGIWANSPSFDLVKCQETVKRLNLRWPFPFWVERDVRTLDAVAWPNGDRPKIEGTAHNALDDAIAQARRVQWGYTLLGLSTAEIPDNACAD